jgi:hypothetical protein
MKRGRAQATLQAGGCLKRWIFPKNQPIFTQPLKFSTAWHEFEGDVARRIPSSMALNGQAGMR